MLGNKYSDDQALTATAVSTNIIDHGPVDSNANIGLRTAELEVLVQVTTAFSGGTSVQVQLQVDDNTGFSSATVIAETEAIAVATLVAGYQFAFTKYPLRLERYSRLRYVVVGTPTAGKVLGCPIRTRQTNGITA